MFSSSEPVAARSNCSYSEPPCVCARLSDPRKHSRRAPPRAFSAWPLILPSKPSITSGFRNNLWRDCSSARWQAGAQTWTQTWTLPPDQRVVKVLWPPKSQDKLYGVWILFKSFDAKFEPSEVRFLRLMPSTGMYCNTCQYIPNMYWHVLGWNLACMKYWFVMYRPNTYLYFQYVPILTPIHSLIWSQCIPMQIDIS